MTSDADGERREFILAGERKAALGWIESSTRNGVVVSIDNRVVEQKEGGAGV